MSHLPVACGTNWIQSSRVGNKHQEMICTPADFSRQSNLLPPEEKLLQTWTQSGRQKLDVEVCIKGVGVCSLEVYQSQAQNSNKKPAVNPSAS